MAPITEIAMLAAFELQKPLKQNNMKLEDFSPEDRSKLGVFAERVLIKTNKGYELGNRSAGIWNVGSCLGRMTVTDSEEVYHSMFGSVPTWNIKELDTVILEKQTELDALKENRTKLL
jgi:hypothetical protein